MTELSSVVQFRQTFETDEILSALGAPTFVLDRKFILRFANISAEQFFQTSSSSLIGRNLLENLPYDSAIFSLINQVFRENSPINEYGVIFDAPKIGRREMSVYVSPLSDQKEYVLVSLQEHTRVQKIGRQLESGNSVRSIMAMGSLLAHEVKNPLSGIRGAAQLLAQNASPEDMELTQLICDETDRIVALVERMQLFSDDSPIVRKGINIHSILNHVRLLAENGFGKHISYTEKYDPSLPLVYGNRDQLIQVILNLVKNASEAVPRKGGEIKLLTAYQPGIRLRNSNLSTSLNLPLVVSIRDNGTGIPEEIRSSLFEPFISSKSHGNGLGLSLVAKIVSDHGGVVEFDSDSTGTIFRIMLPILNGEN